MKESIRQNSTRVQLLRFWFRKPVGESLFFRCSHRPFIHTLLLISTSTEPRRNRGDRATMDLDSVAISLRLTVYLASGQILAGFRKAGWPKSPSRNLPSESRRGLANPEFGVSSLYCAASNPHFRRPDHAMRFLPTIIPMIFPLSARENWCRSKVAIFKCGAGSKIC